MTLLPSFFPRRLQRKDQLEDPVDLDRGDQPSQISLLSLLEAQEQEAHYLLKEGLKTWISSSETRR